jgi:hypothetical protein
MLDNQDLCKRFSQLQTNRKTVEEMWQAIERYVTPYRGDFFKTTTNEHAVEWDKRWVYDSTAIMAHQVLSASLHGALTSPSLRWFQIRYREEELNREKRARQWLEECAEIVYWELQDSNFDLAINETYQDLVGPGTAFLTLEEGDSAGDWGGLHFGAVPLKEGYFEETVDGQPLRFYRELQWTPQQILSKFGDKVPQVVKDKEEHGNNDRMSVLYVIAPRNNKLSGLGQRQAPSRRAWEYKYILKEGAETLGTPGGYYEMPTFCARWRKTSESLWGNSPAMIAMGDVLTLNQARKSQLIAAEKMIDPPILAEERALLTDLDLSSATINSVRDIDKIIPFNTEGSIPISDHMIDQLQAAIRDYFFIDQLRMPAPQAQPMTATEVQLRYEQMQRLLGPTLGRLQSDLLDPIISRAFRMLARANRLPEVPDIVREVNPAYDIEYMGSLARSQKVDQVAAIERYAMTAAQLAEVMPDVLDVPDPHEIMRAVGHALNVPADVMRSKDEVKQIKDDRDERAAEMEATMQDQATGEAAQSLAAGQQAMGDMSEQGGQAPAQPQGGV